MRNHIAIEGKVDLSLDNLLLTLWRNYQKKDSKTLQQENGLEQV